MTTSEFVRTVRQESPVESDDVARDVTSATLETLGERITDGAATDLARHLPEELARPLTDVPGAAEPFDVETFEQRISDRAGIDADEVTAAARGVATALADTAGEDFDNACDQLPPAYDVIVEPSGPDTADAFREAVAERAGLDEETADAAILATLRTVAERLSAGQVDDLAHHVPDEIAAELRAVDDPGASDETFDEFLQRVAQRGSIDKETARTYVQAVGSTLAEAVSDREIAATTEQLPDAYGVMFDTADT